jgi:hypothetical protein
LEGLGAGGVEGIEGAALEEVGGDVGCVGGGELVAVEGAGDDLGDATLNGGGAEGAPGEVEGGDHAQASAAPEIGGLAKDVGQGAVLALVGGGGSRVVALVGAAGEQDAAEHIMALDLDDVAARVGDGEGVAGDVELDEGLDGGAGVEQLDGLEGAAEGVMCLMLVL